MRDAGTMQALARTIIRRIRTRLAHRGESTSDLARETGVSTSTMKSAMALGAGYEDPESWGRRGGTLSLAAVAQALECPVAALTDFRYAALLVDAWVHRPPSEPGQWHILYGGTISTHRVVRAGRGPEGPLILRAGSTANANWPDNDLHLPDEWPGAAACLWPTLLIPEARTLIEAEFRRATRGEVEIGATSRLVSVRPKCTCEPWPDVSQSQWPGPEPCCGLLNCETGSLYLDERYSSGGVEALREATRRYVDRLRSELPGCSEPHASGVE